MSFISQYLKKNSRKLTRISRTITFRELGKVLNKYGYLLSQPKDNYIGIYQSDAPDMTNMLRSVSSLRINRLFKIGFPGWSKQVRIGDLTYLRKELLLTKEYGIDDAAFFDGADDMVNLISSYEGVLRRLAYR